MKTWVLVVVVVGSLGLGFVGGLLTGRQFPAKHYERFGESWYLLDPATGRVCNPLKDPKASQNLLDQGLAGAQGANPSASDPFAAYGGHEIKSVSNFPPPCSE